MKNKPTPDAETPAPEAPPAAADPQVIVRITEAGHGVIIAGCHHAAGKTMEMPKSKAETLAALGKVEIVGVP